MFNAFSGMTLNDIKIIVTITKLKVKTTKNARHRNK